MEFMDDDEWVKSNTDCVYFLASPLTCKKGIECEYRHSEIARLNPRDCRYWFSGLCLNPNCGFRHPPLDGPDDGSFEFANEYDQPAMPLKKMNVPCHFFFNGFCNKGQRCLFLHGPGDTANGEQKKAVTDVVERPAAMEKKTGEEKRGRSDALGPTLAKPTKTVHQIGAGIVRKPEEVEIHRADVDNVMKQAAFKLYSGSLFGENTTRRLSYPPLGNESMYGVSYASPYKSSNDRVESQQEDLLESSPGFDVLVDDISEDLRYEVDPNGFLPEEEDKEGLIMKLMGYAPQPPCEDCESHDDSDVENLHINAIANRVRPRGFELASSQKRTAMRARPASGFRDLRDLLKKRRITNARYQDCFSRTLRSSESEERYPHPRLMDLRCRLSSRVVTNAVGSRVESGNFLNSIGQQSRLRNVTVSRSRKPFDKNRLGKQRFVNDNAASRKKQHSEELMMFTCPKSHVQIIEDRRKPKEVIKYREQIQPPKGTAVEDFQGPKSLSDILEGKRMLKSTVSCVNQ